MMSLNPFITTSSPKMIAFCEELSGKKGEGGRGEEEGGNEGEREETNIEEKEKNPPPPPPASSLLPPSILSRLVSTLHHHFPSLPATVDALFLPSSTTRKALHAQLSVLQGVLFPSRAPLSPPSEGGLLFSSLELFSPPLSFVKITEGAIYFYAKLQPFSFLQAFRFRVGKGGPRVVKGGKGEGEEGGEGRNSSLGKRGASIIMEYDVAEYPKISLTDYILPNGGGGEEEEGGREGGGGGGEGGGGRIEFVFRTMGERDSFVGVVGMVREMARMKEELGWIKKEKGEEEERRGEMMIHIGEGEERARGMKEEREVVVRELRGLLRERKELLERLEERNVRK